MAAVGGCAEGDTETIPSDPPPVCVAPEVALPDGSWFRPGIAPDGCATGFVHDGEYGCTPTLPSERCPPGTMAAIGEDACRPVMSCGQGRWGDLSVDASTQHVDVAYAGSDSDGTADKPWTTIRDAFLAAAPGALIAVAAGSYPEDVVISGKAVRLWGVCPDEVEIVGTDPQSAAVSVQLVAHGSEVGGLAIRGPGLGVLVSGSEGVVLDRLHVHDTAWRGIDVESTLGTTSVKIAGSLVEGAHEAGILIMGSGASIEATSVRATLPLGSSGGRGISVQVLCTASGCDV